MEFLLGPDANSGVYLRGRYEVQLIDEQATDKGYGCGGIYGLIAPVQRAYRGAGIWNTLDIRLVDRQVTVAMNGTSVLASRHIPRITAGALDDDESRAGPIMLQGYSRLVRFRNVWIKPLVNIHSSATLADVPGQNDSRRIVRDPAGSPRWDQTSIEGDWQVTAVRSDGEDTAVPKLDRYVFDKGVLTILTADNPPSRLSYELDPTQDPKQLNLILELGGQRQASPMIFDLKGDTLQICYAAPGDQRPSSLTTTRGDRRTLITMIRRPADGENP